LVRLPGGIKKRRVDGDGGSLEVTEDLAVVKALLGPRGSVERDGRVASGVPNGPRGPVGPRFGVGPMIGRGRERGVASPGYFFSLPSGPVARDRGNRPAGPWPGSR